MQSIVRGIRHRYRQTSLSQRFILGIVLVVVATVVFSGLPAAIAMRLQLEHQVWLRVQDAQAATKGLYDAERTRLKKLCGLIAARPTLYRLTEQGDEQDLVPYLMDLQESAGADALVVVTADQRVGQDLEGLPDPGAFLAGKEPYFADFVSLENPPRVYIVAVSNIQPSGETATLKGWVILAVELKDAYMETLAQETGLAQSLIVEEHRVASSLSSAPDWALNPESALSVETTGEACCTLGSALNRTYYVGLMPLEDSQGQVVALSEVALPGDDIRRGMLDTFLFSVGLSLVVLLGGCWLVAWQARRITRPLLQLSQAAERASQGDLEAIPPLRSGVPEIDQLARQLDAARMQLRQTLLLTQREMKHVERLLSSVPQGVVALDENERITFFNPDAEEILGYQAKNVLYQHFSYILPPAPGETISLGDMLRKPESEWSTQRLNVLDGHKQPILLAVTLSKLEEEGTEGRERETVLTIRDVTEEEAVERVRYNFLANVAHEFRTPLAGIAATTELLVEEGPDLTQGELTELLETISLSTLHLQTLVDNLLESTTIEAGCFQVHRRPISPQDVIQKAGELMSPLFKRRSQKLVVTAPQDLPTFWADPNRLVQVLVNLLSNASKFSPMGGSIYLAAWQEDDMLGMAVMDTGPGLPTGRYADMFKRFVTGSQPREAQYGIGLGLSVVKAIVEAHGGQVGAENRPEGGAKVWFNIPVNPPEERENQ
jgi:PAS domain S-box-containing protein